MTKTPRTDELSAQMMAAGDSPRITTIKLVFHACRLERELIASQSRICELESANAKSTTVAAMPNTAVSHAGLKASDLKPQP